MRYNSGKILQEWFPEQTKSIPSILIWTLIFIADLIAVFFLLEKIGYSYSNLASSSNHRDTYLIVLIGGGLVIFWVETFIYNKLHSLIR